MNQAKNIIFVDDDPDVCWAVGRHLTRAGFTVTTCGDGAEAIPLLEGKDFDVLVTDVQMPQVNGFALLEWVRRFRPGMKVIVITAFGSTTVKEVSFRKGALLYLEKPLDPELLVEMINETGQNESFSGSVHEIDLFDYVQLLILTRRKTVLQVNARDGRTGLIYFKNGEAVHAALDDLEGSDAFHAMLAFEGGSFSTNPWEEPADHSIAGGGEYLLMEAARQKDEKDNPSGNGGGNRDEETLDNEDIFTEEFEEDESAGVREEEITKGESNE